MFQSLRRFSLGSSSGETLSLMMVRLFQSLRRFSLGSSYDDAQHVDGRPEFQSLRRFSLGSSTGPRGQGQEFFSFNR